MNETMLPDADACWTAVERRDATKDGAFYYGVLTTGVYCRPSCAARRPLRKNVRFYATAAAAEREGLRACLRCKPTEATGDQTARRIRRVCEIILRNSSEPVSLTKLAASVDLSPFHLQRSFKSLMGVTPKEFHSAARMKAFKASLRSGLNVTEAIYEAGFGSSSRLYEKVDARLGMTPRQYRQRGRGLGISYASSNTPLGLVMIGATDRGICFVQFGETENELLQKLSGEYPAATVLPMPAARASDFAAWMHALGEHLNGSRSGLELPLDVRGTAFQLRVWRYLQRIPYGEVRSYAEVARDIGRPTAARAVAGACASNTIAVAIPCHRVIRGTGQMGGYRWGLDRKRTLIDRERTTRTHLMTR